MDAESAIKSIEPMLRGVARRYFDTREDVEDGVGDARLAILRLMDRRPDHVDFRLWSFMVARRVMVNSLRRGRVPTVPLQDCDRAGYDSDVGTRLALREFMRALPPRQRRRVVQRADGYSFPEIAAREGCHVSAVFQTMSVVRRKLREVI